MTDGLSPYRVHSGNAFGSAATMDKHATFKPSGGMKQQILDPPNQMNAILVN